MSIPDKLVARLRDIKTRNPKVFLDYDGTLVPIRMDPEDCYPDDELIQLLTKINASYETYIITGRSIEDITSFIGTAYNVIALHGAIKMIAGRVSENVEGLSRYREICDRIYSDRDRLVRLYPGLRMYNKSGNVLFHLGLIEDSRSKEELVSLVESMGCENGMDIYRGKMIIELRVPGMNKGFAIRNIRNGSEAIIAGDDRTDEESFSENPDALRIKVGDGETAADFKLKDYREMRDFLRLL